MREHCHTTKKAAQLAWAAIPLIFSPLVRAEISVFQKGGFEIQAGLQAAFGYFTTQDTNFGLGRIDLRSGANTGDAEWQEAYLKPVLRADYEVDRLGRLYAGVAGVATATIGDGDAGGFTDGGDDDIGLEQAYIGWSSAGLVGDGEPRDVLDISYGRQEFKIGDGFLIYDGDLDQLGKGAAWLSPRYSYKRAALVRINTQPVRGDVFYLEADADQELTELIGINIERVSEEYGTFGLTYLHVFDATPLNFGVREGMHLVSGRVNELSLPQAPNLSLWAEYAVETGSGDDGAIDARAWYAEAQYTLADWPWSPTLGYRYAQFSGGDLGATAEEDFDPLFYGWSRGWGTWYQGEITGEWLLFNSNQVNHMVHLSTLPHEDLAFGAIFYSFSLDADNYFGTPVSASHFADELNVYIDWAINERATVSALYGAAFPGKAAEEAFQDNKTYHLFEIAIVLSF